MHPKAHRRLWQLLECKRNTQHTAGSTSRPSPGRLALTHTALLGIILHFQSCDQWLSRNGLGWKGPWGSSSPNPLPGTPCTRPGYSKTIGMRNLTSTDYYFASLRASWRKTNIFWAFLEAMPAESTVMLKPSALRVVCTEITHLESKKKTSNILLNMLLRLETSVWMNCFLLETTPNWFL